MFVRVCIDIDNSFSCKCGNAVYMCKQPIEISQIQPLLHALSHMAIFQHEWYHYSNINRDLQYLYPVTF